MAEANYKRGHTKMKKRAFQVRVPASTSNLGAGFDCFGLALELYLTVRARVAPQGPTIRSIGEGRAEAGKSRPADNLIFKAMRLAAEREGLMLPPVQLAVHNEVPFGRGLGSSAAAIIAGITLCAAVCEKEIPDDTVLRYALEMEGHADNIGAALLGGFAVACVQTEGNVIALKRSWPPEIKLLVVSPQASLKTERARSALPGTVEFTDAVYNLQRASLFIAALEAGRDDLLWEATRDRLHQIHRQPFVPGIKEALMIPRQPGLLGLALSGSGPSVVALVRDRFTEIGAALADAFQRYGTQTRVRLLKVDGEGRKIEMLR
jgi:homoserine kinase